MTVYLHNVAKVFILRQELHMKRATSCLGCTEDQPNQMAHVTGTGMGCLDPFEDIPEDWFWEAYSTLSTRKVDDLYRKLLGECLVVVLHETATGLEILTGTELMEVVVSDVSYYGNHLYELCEKLLMEEQQDATETTNDEDR